MRVLTMAALFGSIVHACSCMQAGPPCEAAWRQGPVFTAEVISIAEAKPENPGSAWLSKRIQLTVHEAWLGLPADQKNVELLTGLGGGDCGDPFVVGEKYLVYAFRDDQGRLQQHLFANVQLELLGNDVK